MISLLSKLANSSQPFSVPKVQIFQTLGAKMEEKSEILWDKWELIFFQQENVFFPPSFSQKFQQPSSPQPAKTVSKNQAKTEWNSWWKLS